MSQCIPLVNILVVDDNPTNRKLLKVTLEAEGFRTLEAEDGVEGLAILARRSVDAIISDILMPRMDGYRFCHEVRRSLRFGHLPFVMYTGTYKSARDEKLALECGADRYVRKPCPTSSLVGVLREAADVAQSRGPKPPNPPPEVEVMREYSETLVRKLEEKKDELERVAARERILANLSQRALAVTDFGALMREVAEMVPSALDSKCCAVWEALPDCRTLQLRVGAGWENSVVVDRTTIPVESNSPAGSALQSGNTLVVEDCTADTRFPGSVSPCGQGVGSIVAVIIPGLKRPFGVLETCADASKRFAAEDVRFLEAIANILANALRRCQAEDVERKRAEALALANRELVSFTYSVSHDLRAPLRTIKGFSDILLEDYKDKLDVDGQNHLRRIGKGADRMNSLIDDMLSLSTISRQELTIQDVDFSTMAASIIGELRCADPGRNVEAVIEENLHAHGDARLLNLALSNIITNAWKYTGKTGVAQIRIGCREEDNIRVFFVSDNGVGFDKRQAQSVFEPFRRLHPESEFPGTGIGLAIVERVVSRHGGKVWAESEIGAGATFFFTLG